jgi:hypothetical protein
MAFKMKGSHHYGKGFPKTDPPKKERLSDNERGFTQEEFDYHRRRKVKEGWSGSDLKAIMDQWRADKKPTSVTKISKKDLLASGGLSAD